MSVKGRPTRYSKAIVDRIVELVRQGVSKDDAALAAGIAHSTLFEWQAQRPAFAEALSQAREALKPELIGVVYRAAKEDPMMALRMLERLWPGEWGRKQAMVLEGNPDKPIAASIDIAEAEAEIARKLAGMTTDELRALRADRAHLRLLRTQDNSNKRESGAADG